jgi:hypothetical protein
MTATRFCSPPRERRDRKALRARIVPALTRRATSIFTIGLLFLLTFPLRAHDIYSSWAEARILADKLELTLTLARSSAHDLLPDAKKLPAITPENYVEFAPKLRTVAGDLVRIASGGKPLKFVSGDAKISGDADITFTLAYAKPAASPLRFIVDYIGYLVDGHVATVVVTNAAGDDLGWSPVTLDQPVFQVALPSSSPSKKSPAK